MQGESRVGNSCIFSPFSQWAKSVDFPDNILLSKKVNEELRKEHQEGTKIDRRLLEATRNALWLQLCKEILVFVASCKPGQ